MTARTPPIFLVGPMQRRYAKQCIDEAPGGWMVTIQEQTKTREAEEKYHAMIGDIAKQCKFMDKKWNKEDWKRLLIDAFARIKAAEGAPLKGWGRAIPSLDFEGIVQLGIQSRDFRKSEASEFIEYLYAYGSDHDVLWTEPKRPYDEEMMNRR